MAGWGNGKWGFMPWGGIVDRFIKIIYVKITNFINMFFRVKPATVNISKIKVEVYIPMSIKTK